MTSFRSFGEQALHYFDRPHDAVCSQPVETAAAWRGPEIARETSWVVTLSSSQIGEIEAAVAHAKARRSDLGTIGRGDFPLPELSSEISGWAGELGDGRGFMLIRGIPVDEWGEADSSIAYWGLGQHLGIPGGQNPDEELLGHVMDMGEEVSDPFVRRYRTAGNIAYHCDLADVVGLLCLRPAVNGGASRIVSSVSVYNELLRREPDLVGRLFEPFCLDTRNESGGMPYVPVAPCRYADGVLRTFYHSDYFRSAPRHDEVPDFTAEEKALLDRYEEIASSPDLYCDMELQVGDIQLISNHFTMHARTAYDDDPDPAKKRHLLRLWLSLEG